MKLKPIYIYSGLIVIAVVLLIIFSGNPEKKTETAGNQMPQDEIHKGIAPGGKSEPSAANVNEEVKQRMESLKEAYEETPEDTLKMRQYADFLSMAHNQEEAMKLYEKIIKKDPERTDIRLKLSLIYYHMQKFDAAENMVKEILKYDKMNGRAKFNLGVFEANKGNKEKAKELISQVIKENPGTELAKMAENAIKSMDL
jgi:tetratricopeptide (TPR) repeat protein